MPITTKLIDNAIVGWCLTQDTAPVDSREARGGTQLTNGGEAFTVAKLRDLLGEFEDELRQAGLKDSSVSTYVGRSETFIRWLEGDYQPRGPND